MSGEHLTPTWTWVGAIELADGSLMVRPEAVLPLDRTIQERINAMHEAIGQARTRYAWPLRFVGGQADVRS